MPFDPDKFLAESGGFDPDKFLNEAPEPKLDIKEETHPDVTFVDRFKIKNFGNDVEASANYLKDKMPLHEVKVHNGRILLKSPKEKEYRPLDPEGFDWQDITDVGYDVGAGILEGAATAAGGVAGLGAGAVGAVPAAMAAGAGSSASLEALRQKLGQALGVAEEMDSGQVGAAAIAGSVSPLLFGTGAAGKQVLKKAVSKGITKETAEAAQSGLLGRAYKGLTRKVAPKLAEAASGVEANAYKVAVKDAVNTAPGEKTLLETIDEIQPDVYADEIASSLVEAESKNFSDIGKQFQEEIRESGAVIDLKNVKNVLDEKIAHFENIRDQRGYLDPEDLDKLDVLEKVKERAFMRDLGEKETLGISPEGILEKQVVRDVRELTEAEADEVMNIQQILSDAGKVYKDDAKKESAQKYLDGIKKELDREIKSSLEMALPQRKSLAKKFHQAILDQQFLDKNLVQRNMVGEEGQYGSKMLGFLYNDRSYNKAPAYRKLKEIAKRNGVDLEREADTLKAHRYLYKPALTPVSTGGTTSTSRTIPTAAIGGAVGAFAGPYVFGEGGRPLGGGAGVFAGAMLGSPAMMKAALKAGYRKDQLMKGAIEESKRMLPGNRQQYLQSVWNAMRKEDKD